jgi:hypothetical protein
MAPIAAALIALGANACGGSSDGSDGGPPAGSEQARVKAAVEEFYEDLNDYDAAGVCSRMSPKARRQIAAGGIGTGADKGKRTCEGSYAEFLDQAKASGGLKRTASAKVGKVDIDGKEAIVTVDFDGLSGKVPLTEIDGEWKMGVSVASPSAGSSK